MSADLKYLQDRIEERRLRLSETHVAVPRLLSEIRRELALLGAYAYGEPRAASLRRKLLERALGARRVKQTPPRTKKTALSELVSLGQYVLGEPRAASLRRAYLTRWLATQ